MVDFFATWCGPCHRALRDLIAVRDALGPRLRFVLVAVGEPPATVQEFLAHTPLPGGAQVTLDPSGDTMRRWGARTFPTTFLVDRAGASATSTAAGGAATRRACWGGCARCSATHAASAEVIATPPRARAGVAGRSAPPERSATTASVAGRPRSRSARERQCSPRRGWDTAVARLCPGWTKAAPTVRPARPRTVGCARCSAARRQPRRNRRTPALRAGAAGARLRR